MNVATQSPQGAVVADSGVPGAAWLLAAGSILLLYGIPLFELASGLWSQPEYAHGPIILSVSAWLIFRRWPALAKLPAKRNGWGWVVLAIAVLGYVVGRAQQVVMLEIGTLVPFLAGTVLLLCGAAGLRTLAFPICFLGFIVPWPATLVSAVTLPMKLLVSSVAAELLYLLDYPIARSGTILQIGQYQLLVADACAGLHSLFTLEALGLLYLNLVRHDSAARNVALALAIVPIAFLSNVIRVIVLVLVTYRYGDAAGQGFIHQFSGFVLFGTGLFLTIACDSVLRRALPGRCARVAA